MKQDKNRAEILGLKVRRASFGFPAFRGLIRILLIAGLFAGSAAFAADAPQPGPGKGSEPGPLRVFMDSSALDPAALIEGLSYVALVRDRAEAQVEVRITVDRIEGRERYTISLAGLKEFAGIRSELSSVPEPSGKPEDVRKEVAQALELALMRYVVRSPLAGRVRISLKDQVSPTAVIDPWDFWVFSLSATSYISGEQSYLSQLWFGSFSAVRVTPEWKVRLALSGTYYKNHYDYQGYVYDSSLNSQSLRGSAVKSLDDHWSVGADAAVNASSFSNVALGFGIAPAVEFDVFPYSESTKRQLRILYRVGIERVRYVDETIYNQRAETLLRQALSTTLELKRSWGTVSTTLEASSYLHDLSKYHLELNSEVALRILQGLNLTLDGGAAWIHDQISLAKGGATLEDVILQRKQLATSYDVYFAVGLSFSFGSVRSNVVNPRFGNPGGGGYSIQISM